jgi:alanine racemase
MKWKNWKIFSILKLDCLPHIGTAHAANFSSEEELIDEKIKLFKDSEVIIYNGDHSLVDEKIKNYIRRKN